VFALLPPSARASCTRASGSKRGKRCGWQGRKTTLRCWTLKRTPGDAIGICRSYTVKEEGRMGKRVHHGNDCSSNTRCSREQDHSAHMGRDVRSFTHEPSPVPVSFVQSDWTATPLQREWSSDGWDGTRQASTPQQRTSVRVPPRLPSVCPLCPCAVCVVPLVCAKLRWSQVAGRGAWCTVGALCAGACAAPVHLKRRRRAVSQWICSQGTSKSDAVF
jgi:hypothetical protein